MTQQANNRFVEIGRIGRPHGLDGKVRFLPNEHFTDDLFDSVDLFFMKNNRSDLVPVRIENYQTEIKKNQQTFFVNFDTIASRNDAEAAMNKALFIERDKVNSQPEEEEPSLTGYAVSYEGKEIGRVLDVLDNPAHPVLEIKYGSGSLLIPFVDEYIEKTDHENATLYFRNLNQLTDL
ncbi:MAG: ribosome maturation factor RimM [Balneolaceae bacterium]